MKRDSRIYRRVVLAMSLWLAGLGCERSSRPPSPEDVAGRIVDRLRDVPGENTRAALSALTLNAMCSISRLASGEADGRVEQALAEMVQSQPAGIKTRLASFGDTLEQIPGGVRAELLGGLDSFDPGACATAPDWDDLRYGVIFSHQLMPRLRANYCSGNLIYADGTNADRAITANSILHQILPEPDGGPETRVFLPMAIPAIKGVEGEFVSARHPDLAASADSGEGISPFGLRTGIPCSSSDDGAACSSSLGLVCSTRLFGGGTGECFAYPVVQRDQTLVIRGFNFWDVAEARLVFEPAVPGEGTQSTAIISSVDPNEPADSGAACILPGSGNPTHNRAHFRVPANAGHFYRIRLYNHNGQFLTQQDAADHAEPRVIHTCYPPPGPNPDNLPAGTIRDCTMPQEICAQDGATCAVTWSTPPRKLEECRHLPGEPPPCGETPEWYASEKLSPRSDGIGDFSDAIVFVEAEEPEFEIAGTLHALECREETGWDFLGSDEPMLGVIGAQLPPSGELPDLDDFEPAFRSSYDEGDRRVEDFPLVTVGSIPADGSAFFLALLYEDDGFAEAFAAGVVAIALATAILILTGGASIIAAAGGAAGVTLLWGMLVSQFHEEDDLLGSRAFSATPIQMQERIGATHADNFLTTSPPLFGSLPTLEGGANEGMIRSELIHPFEDFSVSDEPLEAECNPGSCPAGEECQVNRCVSEGFVDPTRGVAFRERREFDESGGRYVLDLQWELREP